MASRETSVQRTVGQVSVAHAWGSTVAERAAPLPCDELLPEARCRLNRGVSVHAPVPALYRWLCQLSVAPYSYDLIDNRGRRSPQELIPGADRLTPGQRFMSILRLSSFERDDHLTLGNRRTAVTYAVRAGQQGVRLVARILFQPPGAHLGAATLGPALAFGDLVMMRKQLLNLKSLAERDARRAASAL